MNSISQHWMSRKAREHFRNSVPKGCTTAIDFHIFHILPIFIEELAGNFECDPMSGCYQLPTTEPDLYMYCTPYWETDAEIILCSLVDGHGQDRGTVEYPFPKKDLTFHPRTDAAAYIKAVKHAAVDLDVTLLLNGQGA